MVLHVVLTRGAFILLSPAAVKLDQYHHYTACALQKPVPTTTARGKEEKEGFIYRVNLAEPRVKNIGFRRCLGHNEGLYNSFARHTWAEHSIQCHSQLFSLLYSSVLLLINAAAGHRARAQKRLPSTPSLFCVLIAGSSSTQAAYPVCLRLFFGSDNVLLQWCLRC